MLVRVLTGVIGIPVILAIVFLTPGWALAILFSVLIAIAQWEMLWATGIEKSKYATGVAMAFGAAVPFWVWFSGDTVLLTLGVTVLILVLFLIAFLEKKSTFQSVSAALFSAVLISLMLSDMLAIRQEARGLELVLLPMAIAWMSDTGGYFFGRWFGKKKLCPAISPKKTVAGSVGAEVFALAGALIYALVLYLVCDFQVSWVLFGLLGIVGSAAAQLGDLVFSFIKREHGIKDYGNIIPGHGGVLDRFDSVIFTVPLCFAALKLLPLVL